MENESENKGQILFERLNIMEFIFKLSLKDVIVNFSKIKNFPFSSQGSRIWLPYQETTAVRREN